MFPTLMTSSCGNIVHANDKVIKQGYAELKVEDELKNTRLFYALYIVKFNWGTTLPTSADNAWFSQG